MAALLSSAMSAAAFQQAPRPVTTTVVPRAPYAASTAAPPNAPRTYDECLRSYVRRADPTAYCRRLFPDTAPSTMVPGTASTSGDSTRSPSREPVNITPQLESLIDAWRNRPRTPPATSRPPADPLAVIPDIQAACAAYAATPERWRRCTADGWRQAGLRGQPPLVLQTPPAIEPPPVTSPPVTSPPAAPPPVRPPPVQSKPVQARPPVQTPPALTPPPVVSEPVKTVPAVEPELPPVAVVEPSPAPPKVAPTPPRQALLPVKTPAVPIWLWLVAMVVAAGGGFGLARWLGRPRPAPSRAAQTSPAPCMPEIALVPDPGVVILKPDGSPRAGMAVSLHFAFAADTGEVRLDYPSLETAP